MESSEHYRLPAIFDKAAEAMQAKLKELHHSFSHNGLRGQGAEEILKTFYVNTYLYRWVSQVDAQ